MRRHPKGGPRSVPSSKSGPARTSHRAFGRHRADPEPAPVQRGTPALDRPLVSLGRFYLSGAGASRHDLLETLEEPLERQMAKLFDVVENGRAVLIFGETLGDAGGEHGFIRDAM